MNHMDQVRALRADTTRHYNCAQSILVAFSDVCGISPEQAYALGEHFGAGMKCGNICGTLTGAYMVLGMAGKELPAAQQLMQRFNQRHVSNQCRLLLADASQRGVARKEHCDGLVFEVAEYLDQVLKTSSR